MDDEIGILIAKPHTLVRNCMANSLDTASPLPGI